MPAIEAKGLKRTFAGDVLAVAGVDLEVGEGEIYAFLGPNVAGKLDLQTRPGVFVIPGSDVGTGNVYAGYLSIAPGGTLGFTAGGAGAGAILFDGSSTVAFENGRASGSKLLIGGAEEMPAAPQKP